MGKQTLENNELDSFFFPVRLSNTYIILVYIMNLQCFLCLFGHRTVCVCVLELDIA